ncbi:hypothetical protein scyTo_0022385, partial [Scyliorhinus torazame]|nr:hypothetical protein [Scyliorhinus torazame]
ITEIMIGIIQMLFGLCLNFVESYVFAVLIGVPWWTGIWYIISGSLVVDIINTSNAHLKQVILLMHIVSSIAALIGTAAYFVSLYLMPPLNTNFFYVSISSIVGKSAAGAGAKELPQDGTEKVHRVEGAGHGERMRCSG